MKWRSWVAAIALGLSSLVVAAPARADDSSEIYAGCDHTLPSLGSAGYSVTFDGVSIPVTITVGWQYVGGSGSNCEDINVFPADGHTWNLMSPRKARTYMCNSAGTCWYNAWRDIGAGSGIVATDMANGTQYQVHFAIYGDDGPWIHEYD